MSIVCIHEENLGKILEYLHPNFTKKFPLTFFHIIMVVVFEKETELERKFYTIRENSVLIQLIP